MMIIKPFDSKRNYTPMHNYMYDVAMPKMSSNAWVALSFFVRQTDGWNVDDAGLSYNDIKRGTGIKSDGTVSRVIQELIDYKYIVVKPSANTWEPNRYALNADLEIEADYYPTDYRVTPTSKIVVAPTLFGEPQPEQVKRKRGRKPNSEKSPEELAAHQEYLARKREIEEIWIECIGVKPVHFGETAKSSKALAEAGYTGEQVRGCFKHMLERKFWRDKFNAGEPIKLASVANELPTWLQVSEKEQARKQAEQQRIEQERARRAQQNAPMSPEARAAAARTAQEMRQRMQQAVV